jgi:hypothetical protein
VGWWCGMARWWRESCDHSVRRPALSQKRLDELMRLVLRVGHGPGDETGRQGTLSLTDAEDVLVGTRHR